MGSVKIKEQVDKLIVEHTFSDYQDYLHWLDYKDNQLKEAIEELKGFSLEKIEDDPTKH